MLKKWFSSAGVISMVLIMSVLLCACTGNNATQAQTDTNAETITVQVRAANVPQMEEEDWLTEEENTLGIAMSDDMVLTTEQYSEIAGAVEEFTENGWRVGFVLTDLSSEDTISYCGDLELYSASAIKGPYVISLLDAGYEPTDTMERAIAYSDNTAYSSLRETYGASVFQTWLTDAGGSEEQGEAYYTTTTSEDLAKMWQYAYGYFESGDYRDWAADTFSDTLNSALSAELGEENTVWSKSGWIAEGGYYNVYNGAGIIDDGESPYVLAIMSDAPGTTGEAAAQQLAAVLHTVHQELMED